MTADAPQLPEPPRVAVIGAGSWGTALAALACRHAPTLLWARRPEAAAELARLHENTTYLPGITLPSALNYTADLDAVAAHLQGAGYPLIVLGVPVAGLREACRDIAHMASAAGLTRLGLVWTCKGFDAQTSQLPHEVATQVLGERDDIATGVLSGPSFAREVALGLPVALTIASLDARLREQVTLALHGETARIYSSDDLIGVEAGGALKNVMAIACGVADGLGLGTNARAALITRGLAEMTRLGLALGARADTFAGLTGLGDLVLTTTGDLSRNRRVGLELGRGRSLADILRDTPTAEGVRCARAALALARRHGVEMPITEAVCGVLFEGQSAADAVTRLLSREPRNEDTLGNATGAATP